MSPWVFCNHTVNLKADSKTLYCLPFSTKNIFRSIFASNRTHARNYFASSSGRQGAEVRKSPQHMALINKTGPFLDCNWALFMIYFSGGGNRKKSSCHYSSRTFRAENFGQVSSTQVSYFVWKQWDVCFVVKYLATHYYFLLFPNLRLELEVEPIFATMALYDGRLKKKVSVLQCEA